MTGRTLTGEPESPGFPGFPVGPGSPGDPGGPCKEKKKPCNGWDVSISPHIDQQKKEQPLLIRIFEIIIYIWKLLSHV